MTRKAIYSNTPDEENKINLLKKAIEEGINSGMVKNFDPCKELKKIKSKRKMGSIRLKPGSNYA